MSNAGQESFPQASFRTTHWTVVLEAARPEAPKATEAFAQLYRDYLPPLYAFVRRRGFAPADAADLTQGFFVRLLEKNGLNGLQRDGGRFRSYLLSGLNHFLINEWDRAQAHKRGSGQSPLSLDADHAEAFYLSVQDESNSPEVMFERQWVFALLAHVMQQLQDEVHAGGRERFFEDAKPHLQGERNGLPYAEIAARHAMSEGAVKVAVHRLRHRYGELLRQEITRTVASPVEVEDELRHLLRVVAG